MAKLTKDKIFKVYSDPAHGWMAVKLSDLIILGILQKISKYSYIKGKTAYLEEDGDMTKFCNAFKERFGQFPQLKHNNLDKLSPIRSYERYPFDCNN